MKLSTRTRYGTRLMVVLALRYGNGPVLLREISAREVISEKYLSQIVIPLRSASLIRSVRGARGGYVLAREPKQINLREIVEVLEGGLDLIDSGGEPENGRSRAARAVREVWQELAVKMARSLASVTLEEMVQRVRDAGEAGAMYNI